MKGHIATVHEGNKKFKCNICNDNFGYKFVLNKHFVTVNERKKEAI